MVRILSVGLCMIFFLSAGAQTYSIKGKVVDAISLNPLAFASVFISSTTIGVNTDESGNFTLNNIPEGEQELVCSYAGSETYYLKFTRESFPSDLIIKLLPVELKEVEISEKEDKEWKSQLKRFELEFLGEERSACKISNPWVLDFQDLGHNVMIAKASAPLEIENHGLGYTISYILKDFTVAPNAYNIRGTTHFKQMTTEDPKVKARWKANRIRAYNSSLSHLLKAIINNKVKEEGFDLYEDKNPESTVRRNASFASNLETLSQFNAIEAVTVATTNKFAIRFPTRLEIHYIYGSKQAQFYKDVRSAVGWIEMRDEILIVNEQGFALNPAAIVVSGYLAQPRIAQMLPNDYSVNKM